MAGADYADGKILTRSLAHERSQFVLRTRLRLVPGDEGLVANPIAPVPARPQLRRRPLRDTNHVVIPLTARHREHQPCALVARATPSDEAASNETTGIKEAPLWKGLDPRVSRSTPWGANLASDRHSLSEDVTRRSPKRPRRLQAGTQRAHPHRHRRHQ